MCPLESVYSSITTQCSSVLGVWVRQGGWSVDGDWSQAVIYGHCYCYMSNVDGVSTNSKNAAAKLACKSPLYPWVASEILNGLIAMSRIWQESPYQLYQRLNLGCSTKNLVGATVSVVSTIESWVLCLDLEGATISVLYPFLAGVKLLIWICELLMTLLVIVHLLHFMILIYVIDILPIWMHVFLKSHWTFSSSHYLFSLIGFGDKRDKNSNGL